jgi:SAM-dependent methyltransferase
MNTFEHVYDVQFLLNEVARVLKPKGKFIASTPFLHPIHAHPDDFFRPTPSWWFESLRRAGFTEVTVAPLGWGPLSTGLIASGTHGPFRVRQRQIALLLDLMFMKTLERGKSLEHVKEAILKHALGFFVTASK